MDDTPNHVTQGRFTAMTNNGKKGASATYFLGILLCFIWLAPATSAAEAPSLQPRTYADSLVRVKTIVDVSGSLNLETQDKKSLEFPMQVNAEFFFDELGLPGEHSPAIRHYWDAKANFVVNDEKETRALREDRQLIVLSNDTKPLNRFWSPHGMLLRSELDLLDVAGTAFPPELLLPEKEVDASATWSVRNDVAAQLLRINEVTRGELINSVKETTESVVKIELKGEVEGIADGAKTKIEVSGNYHFDKTHKMVTWFAVAMHEQREIGFAAPGFDITAKIRSARQSIDKSDALPATIVEQARRAPSAGDVLLDFHSDDDLRYRAALDRRWHLVKRQQSSVLLRLVDEGDLLLTCKADRLNRLPAGKQITLDGFQSDVRAALATNCKEIISASESVNPQGIRVLRVVASGDVAETPIRWIYYHLSDDEGQRLSLIFTHESTLESRIAGIDEAMTSSITLLPRVDHDDSQANANTARLK